MTIAFILKQIADDINWYRRRIEDQDKKLHQQRQEQWDNIRHVEITLSQPMTCMYCDSENVCVVQRANQYLGCEVCLILRATRQLESRQTT